MRREQAARLEALVQEAARVRAGGDLQTAVAIASQAASEGLAHPLFLQIRAEALRGAGRFQEAGQLLNQALALAPHDARTIVEIGRLLNAEERTNEAVVALEAAVARQPDSIEAWNALGSVQAGAGNFAAARVAFERAAALAPHDPGPLGSLAFMEARSGNLREARVLAGSALRMQQDHPLAVLTLAMAEVYAQEFEAARARLETLLAGSLLNNAQRQIALGLLGDAFDGLGRIDDAYSTYTRMKERFAARHAKRYGNGGSVESHLDFIRRLGAWFERQDMVEWSRSGDSADNVSPVKRHVFLLGYLRSGVTLAESILASLPETRVLEEGATLLAADLTFLRNDETLAKLNPLDTVLARQARDAYWRRVREQVPDVDGRIFVDMSPLYGVKLAMIARLFPQARVVVCRRDPRDVVLSCMRRNFTANALTYQLTSLETIARHYDAAMRLTELHLKSLPLPSHVVEYSRLVGDFDATTRALADFVGAPWTEEVRDFSTTAASRQIRTPSASQVRRSLYDGTGQWIRYQKYLEPVLPLLAPWIERFGYPT
jgi:Flp pilus assembly protein TadD